jgi:hypothetical protein
MFYVSIECPNCDTDVLFGPCLTLITHDGSDVPVIPFDVASQTTFHCEKCGVTFYTGDFDTFCDESETETETDDDDDVE